MSSAGRAENSNGCAIRPREHGIGLRNCFVQIQSSLLTGSYVMATAEQWEPYESRGSRTVVCPVKASMFSRRQTCRGRSQSPVVWIAEGMETEPSKPIDKIFLGEITSHWAVSKENALWPRK